MFWNVRATFACLEILKIVQPFELDGAAVVMRQADGARGRFVKSGDAVEDGGLAGAVRPDQRGDLAPLGGKGEPVDRDHAAEAHGEAFDAEDGIAAHPRPSLASSEEIGGALLQEDRRRAMADQAARPPDHQQHHRHAEHQHAVLIESAEQLKAADQGKRCQRDAELRTHAAEHDDREYQRQFLEGEGFRTDETLSRGEESAGKAAEHRTRRERREFGRGDVDAQARGRRLHPRASASQARPIGRRRSRIVTQLVSNASARIT